VLLFTQVIILRERMWWWKGIIMLVY
jgi:hypothetical protein